MAPGRYAPHKARYLSATTRRLKARRRRSPNYAPIGANAACAGLPSRSNASLRTGSGGTFDEDPAFSVGMASSYPGTSASWTAAVSNFSTRDSEFEVIAVCAAASAFPHYAIPSTSASDPAGVQKGIIQSCAVPAVVLGGGNQSFNTTNLRIEMKTTQPYPASGTSWKSGENNDTSAGTTLTSYAICATQHTPPPPCQAHKQRRRAARSCPPPGAAARKTARHHSAGRNPGTGPAGRCGLTAPPAPGSCRPRASQPGRSSKPGSPPATASPIG
jgi:hypothetical protein